MNEIRQSEYLIQEKNLDLPEYIDRSSFVKNKQGHYLLQFTGWTFWSFLFVPLFTLILWLYQGNLIRNYIFAEKFDVQLLNEKAIEKQFGFCPGFLKKRRVPIGLKGITRNPFAVSIKYIGLMQVFHQFQMGTTFEGPDLGFGRFKYLDKFIDFILMKRQSDYT